MNLSRSDFVDMLREKRSQTDDPAALADWAHEIYLRHTDLDPAVYRALMELIAMNEGDQFVMSPSELDDLTERLTE